MEKIPIIKVGEILLVSIQIDFHDRLALALLDDLSNKIVDTGAKGVLIDISGLEMVDSFMGRIIGNIAKTARLLDAQTVLVGMQPAIAMTITELGISLKGIRTALDAEAGLGLLKKMIRDPIVAGSNNGRQIPRN